MGTFTGILKFTLLTVLMAAAVSAKSIISKEDDKSTTIRCKDVESMIGNVPHPGDCNKFYSCVPAPPGAGYDTMPVEMNCPSGSNGPLFYDFRSCQCHYDNSLCFDPFANSNDFFTCAEVYILPILPVEKDNEKLASS